MRDRAVPYNQRKHQVLEILTLYKIVLLIQIVKNGLSIKDNTHILLAPTRNAQLTSTELVPTPEIETMVCMSTGKTAANTM